MQYRHKICNPFIHNEFKHFMHFHLETMKPITQPSHMTTTVCLWGSTHQGIMKQIPVAYFNIKIVHVRHTHAHTHMHTHTHTHTNTHANTHTCTHACTHAQTHTHTHKHKHSIIMYRIKCSLV